MHRLSSRSKGFDRVRVSRPSLPSSRSGPAVKGGPTGPSEASREAASLTAGKRRLRTDAMKLGIGEVQPTRCPTPSDSEYADLVAAFGEKELSHASERDDCLSGEAGVCGWAPTHCCLSSNGALAAGTDDASAIADSLAGAGQAPGGDGPILARAIASGVPPLDDSVAGRPDGCQRAVRAHCRFARIVRPSRGADRGRLRTADDGRDRGPRAPRSKRSTCGGRRRALVIASTQPDGADRRQTARQWLAAWGSHAAQAQTGATRSVVMRRLYRPELVQ